MSDLPPFGVQKGDGVYLCMYVCFEDRVSMRYHVFVGHFERFFFFAMFSFLFLVCSSSWVHCLYLGSYV